MIRSPRNLSDRGSGSRVRLLRGDVERMPNSNKLNIGCGSDIRAGYVNLDAASLPGVDIVHDLNEFPYPFEDNTFAEILAINVLEHLPDTVTVMEELYRIASNKCIIHIRVPYWNSYITYADPTHIKGFHPMQFEFFDPTKDACKNRPYYSQARFRTIRLDYFIWLKGWRLIRNRQAKRLLEMLSSHLCNIIHHIDITMEVVK
jgi:SAM-dependent methyltransferase